MAPPSADLNHPSPPPSSGNRSTGASNPGTLDGKLESILSSSSQFSVASYINLALEDRSSSSDSDNHEHGDDLQQRMAQLALQLQLQTQACHEDIGRIGAELQAVLPRCAADVGRVGVGLEGLRMDAVSLLESTAVTDSEEDVSSSLETLSTLHALQANLTRTQEILTAAATWDTTLSAVAPLLAQQNLTEAVHCLAQLENGERALRGMPHPEERTQAIAKIRQSVSVMLQPQLKHALQNMSTRLQPLQQCVALYTKLNKMDALSEEYVKMRPAAIHKAWFDYRPGYDHNRSSTTSTSTSSTTTESGSNEHNLSQSERDLVAGQAFAAWLPQWFDAVLSLLAEERRQSMQVFGPELVNEIILKVFAECFRPILASFESRLESIHSSKPSGPCKGSLESICTVYESTLQFLSLAYESIAGGWLDMVEANLVPGHDGISLYNDMTAVFLRVASPFVSYQTHLPELETKHSGAATQKIAKDVRQVVGGVSSAGSALETLQYASERLQELSYLIFPLAEGAVARFELLNGGYAATKALSSVDKLLSGQAGELAIAIHTLSTALTADEKQLADNFDEQHVLCALEVLKVAGSFRRDLGSFEDKSRERLGVLRERMASHSAQAKKVKEASLKTAPKTGMGSFVLPDSLSVVEIDSFLTQAICDDTDLDDMSASYTVLQRLTADDRGVVPLYPEADEATKRLANSCHTFVFDVCSSVPRYHLSGMGSMTCWREEAGEENIASYGTLPQTYITQIGEHMLALVQALEPFASESDALALANEVMDGLRDVAVRPWRDFLDASGSTDSDKIVRALMDGKELAEFALGYAEMLEDEEDLEEEEDEAMRKSSAFCNAWLDVVGLAVAGRLLERIMRIPSLTPKGCEHLNADLNYLVNVFSALGVSGHPHPLLGHIAEIAMLSGEDLAQQMATRDRGNPVQKSLLSIEERVAAMRGLSANYNY